MQKPPPRPRVHLPPPLGGQGAVAGGGTPTFAKLHGGKGGGAGAPVREAPRGGSVPPCVKDCPGHGGSPRRERSPPPLLRGGEKNTQGELRVGPSERRKNTPAALARPHLFLFPTRPPRAPPAWPRPQTRSDPRPWTLLPRHRQMRRSRPHQPAPRRPPPMQPTRCRRARPSRPSPPCFRPCAWAGGGGGRAGLGAGWLLLPALAVGGWTEVGREGGREREREGEGPPMAGGRGDGCLGLAAAPATGRRHRAHTQRVQKRQQYARWTPSRACRGGRRGGPRACVPWRGRAAKLVRRPFLASRLAKK